MISRKALFIAYTMCASDIGVARAQAPADPGLSPEQAAAFQSQAAAADQIKNALPNAQALSDLAKAAAQGVGKTVAQDVLDMGAIPANELAGQVKEQAAGVESPNAAVSDLAKKIIKTDRLFNDMADWRTVPRGNPPTDAATPTPPSDANTLKSIDPKTLDLNGASMVCATVGVTPQDVLCKPNLRYTLYCSYKGARIPGTTSMNYSNGAVAFSCTGRNVSAILGAWNLFPPQFAPYVRRINGSPTLEGVQFVGPCRPPSGERCGNVLEQLFGR